MLKHPETFFSINKHKKTFITRLNKIGPKNQAKEYIQGEKLPYYFIYAEQLTQGFKYSIDSLPCFFDDYLSIHHNLIYELIPQGYPVKLYFDLEYLIEYNPWTTMTIAAAKLHQLTQQLLMC